MKNSSGWLTRKNGVWVCIIAMMIMLITGFIPVINSDIGGIFGLGVLILGLILIAVRWKY